MTLGVTAEPAHLGESVRHRVVKHIDERVRRFRQPVGRWGERSDYRNGYIAAGDLSERLTRGACRGHAVGDDAIHRPTRTGQRDAEAAPHESANPPITRPMTFWENQQTRFTAIDPVDGLDEGLQFGPRKAGPLRDERKSCKSRQWRNGRNAAPVPVASRNECLGTRNQREANGDIEDRLMVHHDDAAFPRNFAVNRKPHATHHASHPQYRSGVGPEPRADECSTIARQQNDRRPEQQPLTEANHDDRVAGEHYEERPTPESPAKVSRPIVYERVRSGLEGTAAAQQEVTIHECADGSAG